MYQRLISATWALEPKFHDAVLSIALKRFAQGKEPIIISTSNAKAARPSTTPVSGKIDGLNVSGNIRLLTIDGVMSRNGDLCAYGTEDMSRWIREANADPLVSAILIKINSGGGDVDGTEQLAETIKSSKKPVLAFVAGTGASAAYWIASQCREIIMETATTAFVGSIGVLAMHVDATKAMEQEGYKVTIVRADGSEDKAAFNSYEPLTEQVMSDTKATLTSIRSTFVAAVKAGRPKVTEKVFGAKMYDGNAAIKEGLADKIGNFDYASKRAMFHARKDELAAQKSQSSNQNSNNKMYTKLSAALGGEIPAEISEESCVALEAALLEKDNRIAALELSEKATKKANTDLTTQVADLATTRASLKAFEDTGIKAEQVIVLSAWYESAKGVGTPPGADANHGGNKLKKVSSITQAAIDMAEKMK